MPIYEYGCNSCGYKFQRLQPMNSTGADCPVCEQPARRALSVFAAITAGAVGDDDAPDPLPPMGGEIGCGGGGCGHCH